MNICIIEITFSFCERGLKRANSGVDNLEGLARFDSLLCHESVYYRAGEYGRDDGLTWRRDTGGCECRRG